jgi:hypothetical protein
MTPETHPIEKEQVMAYLDGELTPERASRIAVHLEQCVECRELAVDLRGISSQMVAWGVEPTSKRLGEAVMTQLIEGGGQKAGAPTYKKRVENSAWKRLLHSRWAWATAGIVAVVVCIFAVDPDLLVTHKAVMSEAVPARTQSRATAGLISPLDQGSFNDKSAGVLGKEKVNQISSGPMIARKASLNISVKDFNAARISMDRIVAAHKGFVSQLSISSQQGAPQSLSAKLAIPAAQCDAALADLKALGRVAQEQQGGEEVTSQVVDLDARLKNVRETETQLTDILRTRTGKIGDVLEVEEEMARVRGDIEQMEAEQKQLRDRVTFASIDLIMTEEYQAQLGGGPSSAGRQIRNALVEGYHDAVDGLLSVFVFLLNVGPSLLVWGLILLLPARWAWRRWRKSRADFAVDA